MSGFDLTHEYSNEALAQGISPAFKVPQHNVPCTSNVQASKYRGTGYKQASTEVQGTSKQVPRYRVQTSKYRGTSKHVPRYRVQASKY